VLIDLIEKELNAMIPVYYRVLEFVVKIYEYGDYRVVVESNDWYSLGQTVCYIPKQKGFGHFMVWLKANKTEFVNSLLRALIDADKSKLKEKIK